MLTPLQDSIEKYLQEAFMALGLEASLGRIVLSNQPALGQFQCNGAFKGAKAKGCSPLALAENLLEQLEGLKSLATLTISQPGFINIAVHDQVLGHYVQAMSEDPRLGVPVREKAARIGMDFGGVNIAKAMHVGHLRSSIIGESLQRIFRFLGDEVVSDIHLGDWGLPMGMLIEEFKQRYPEWPYFRDDFTSDPFDVPPFSIDDLETLYPLAATRCKEPAVRERARQATAQLQGGRSGYRALWQRFREVSVEDVKRQFEPLDIHFDLWLGESSVNARVERLLQKLKEARIAGLSEGATIIEVAEPFDKSPMPPLILVTSEGSVTYGMTDLATLEERIETLHPQHILYVVDNRQSLHFEQVFRGARKAGMIGTTGLEHIAFGTLNGPDGKPFKTRAGGVMKLEDLLKLAIEKAKQRLEEANLGADFPSSERESIAKNVAISAIKFADLAIPRTSDYVFDLDKFVSFQGRTGPYLLYTAVRIKSLLAKAREQGRTPGTLLPPGEEERDIILKLLQLPLALRTAYEERAPHYLCEFAYALAQSFSAFYQSCHILTHDNQEQAASWLGLCALTLQSLERVLELLGISIPERM